MGRKFFSVGFLLLGNTFRRLLPVLRNKQTRIR